MQAKVLKMGNKGNSFPKVKTLRCGEKIIDFSTPRIMGILNVTPDSFYDGGLYTGDSALIERVKLMIDEGADIIDVGAVSTRPGAKSVSLHEEMSRLLPAVKAIKREFPGIVLSIDTFRSETAIACVDHGAAIINDISGGTFDKLMFQTIARLKVPYVLMHIHGTPETMQNNPISLNAVQKVKNFLSEKVSTLRNLGVTDIILDPGFGFGKSMPANYRLLKNLENLRIDNLPLLTGISRKSLVNKILDTSPAGALNGTTVLNTIALLNGTNILRVHDVKEAVEAVKIVEYYRNS